jgi:hypothetical protein
LLLGYPVLAQVKTPNPYRIYGLLRTIPSTPYLQDSPHTLITIVLVQGIVKRYENENKVIIKINGIYNKSKGQVA